MLRTVTVGTLFHILVDMKGTRRSRIVPVNEVHEVLSPILAGMKPNECGQILIDDKLHSSKDHRFRHRGSPL